MAGYVKFLRGTQAAFDRVTTKDNDTLYFIYSADDASKGSLYLGNKQIITGIVDGTDAKDLGELGNVLIASVGDKDVLSYDSAAGKWVNRSISEIVAEIMSGATADKDGASGLVPAPKAGDENKFLRGDATWVSIPAGDLTAEQIKAIPELITTVGIINGDKNIEGSFRNVIKTEVTNLIGGAGEAFDTLKEIQDWITTDGDATNKLVTRVGNLETDMSNTKTRLDDLDTRLQWVEITE